MSLWIKICGITRPEDAQQAVALGADALGFNFYPESPRYVSAEDAREIVKSLPPKIEKIGVFVNHARDEVARMVRSVGLTGVQVHGDESADFFEAWPYNSETDSIAPARLRMIRAIRARTAAEVQQAIESRPADLYLIDAYTPKAYGGTGERASDEVIEAALTDRHQLTVLAGGLRPDNLASVLARFRPFGVDVASGVEFAPGKKDQALLAEFIRIARSAA